MQEVPDGEEGALGEEVAVGLVLELPHGGGGVPQASGAGEETEGVGGEVVFGIGDGVAGVLEEGEEEEPEVTQQVGQGAVAPQAVKKVKMPQRAVGGVAAPQAVAEGGAAVSGCRRQPGRRWHRRRFQ